MKTIKNHVTGKEYKVKERSSKYKKGKIEGLWSKKKKVRNTHAKGNRIEREFIQVLKNSGKFAEIWKPCHCRGNSDIFGLFDIMALETKYIDTKFLHLFQIKGNKSDYYKAKKKAKEFAFKYMEVETYVVLRVKKGLWRIAHFYVDTFAGGEYQKEEFYVNDKFEEVDKNEKKRKR